MKYLCMYHMSEFLTRKNPHVMVLLLKYVYENVLCCAYEIQLLLTIILQITEYILH